MKHPPIPPNCPWFDTDRDGANWFMYPGQETGMGMHEVVWLDGPMCVGHHRDVILRDFRPIIAAVARCAWLDEAFGTSDKVGLCFSSKADECMRGRAAIRNADAWAKWARGEAWE